MTKTYLVYIAGAYSASTYAGVERNIKYAIYVGNEVAKIDNCVPFVPHLFHYWNALYPKSYEYWLNIDMEYLLKCDVVLRIDNASSGADKECEYAIENDIPVVHGIDELEEWLSNMSKTRLTEFVKSNNKVVVTFRKSDTSF